MNMCSHGRDVRFTCWQCRELISDMKDDDDYAPLPAGFTQMTAVKNPEPENKPMTHKQFLNAMKLKRDEWSKLNLDIDSSMQVLNMNAEILRQELTIADAGMQ